MTRTRHVDDSSKPESRLLNHRNLLLCGTALTVAFMLCALETTSLAQQTTGTPGSPERHDDHRWQAASACRLRSSAA